MEDMIGAALGGLLNQGPMIAGMTGLLYLVNKERIRERTAKEEAIKQTLQLLKDLAKIGGGDE